MLVHTAGELTGVGTRVITRITADSRTVTPGSLFVAIRGTRHDGHDHVHEAIQKGAVAVVIERDAEVPETSSEIPLVRVEDTRRALAHLASRFFGGPAERLTLVGVTGTIGKTSIVTMLEALLETDGVPAGVIGSLGIRVCGEEIRETGYTSPDSLRFHEALARIEAGGCEVAAIEVTSHALAQERMYGVRLALGIFTNLIPLEHADYHGSFRNYVDAKRRFLELLHPNATLVYNADDRAVRRIARGATALPVSCGRSPRATVRIEDEETQITGTRLTLNVRRPLPRLGGGEVQPFRFNLDLRLLGRSNVTNAALAAAGALTTGIAPDVIARSLHEFSAPPRRMQVVRNEDGVVVLDDTVGHPDSISAVCEVAEAFAPGQIHVAYAVRGSRGVRINRQIGEALAIWAGRLPIGTLVITRSEEATDDRNRVADLEFEALATPLRREGIRFMAKRRLDEAVLTAAGAAREGEMVILLGAQGMDAGQQVLARGNVASASEE